MMAQLADKHLVQIGLTTNTHLHGKQQLQRTEEAGARRQPAAGGMQAELKAF